jgi:hypothetical protein
MSLYGYQCIQCQRYWATHAHPEMHRYITLMCPTCIAVLPDKPVSIWVSERLP